MAGFTPFRKEGGATQGEMRAFIIENSATITLGDMVDVTAGFAGLAGAGTRVMGCVVGLVRDIGQGSPVALGTDAASGFTGSRTGNAGSIGSDTYAAASDNETVDKVMAYVVIDPKMEYYNDADGSLAQAQIGTYYDLLAASDQIDQSTTTTYSAQMVLMAIDPFNDGDASKGIFRVVEHQLTA